MCIQSLPSPSAVVRNECYEQNCLNSYTNPTPGPYFIISGGEKRKKKWWEHYLLTFSDPDKGQTTLAIF